jgi:hypothetical protein
LPQVVVRLAAAYRDAGFRAVHDRAAHRDFIDVHAANARLSWGELETRGARHTAGFSLEQLADRLGAVDERDERTFAFYGLDVLSPNRHLSGPKPCAA